MKTTASILATAALLTGMAMANAQTSSTPGPESQKTLDNAGGAERNPDGSTGGSKTNPSPEGTTGAAAAAGKSESDESGHRPGQS